MVEEEDDDGDEVSGSRIDARFSIAEPHHPRIYPLALAAFH